jgi:hypothetical protein
MVIRKKINPHAPTAPKRFRMMRSWVDSPMFELWMKSHWRSTAKAIAATVVISRVKREVN